jgi:hypothetical protein
MPMSDEEQEDWLGFPSVIQGKPLPRTPSPDELEQLKKDGEQLEKEMRDANYAAFGGLPKPYEAYDSDDDDEAYDSDDDDDEAYDSDDD